MLVIENPLLSGKTAFTWALKNFSHSNFVKYSTFFHWKEGSNDVEEISFGKSATCKRKVYVISRVIGMFG